jgi:hypothetical protein
VNYLLLPYDFNYDCNNNADSPSKSLNREIINSQKCLTQECEEVSNVVRRKLDVKVDPCNDFYHFACGSWMEAEERALATKDQTCWDIFDEIKTKLVGRFEGKQYTGCTKKYKAPFFLISKNNDVIRPLNLFDTPLIGTVKLLMFIMNYKCIEIIRVGGIDIT